MYVYDLSLSPVFKALLELWHAGVLKKFDEEKLLVKAESAKLYVYSVCCRGKLLSCIRIASFCSHIYTVVCTYSYRLCELLYEKKRQFAKVLSCYLRDPNRRVSG